jgi:hypothetical protein
LDDANIAKSPVIAGDRECPTPDIASEKAGINRYLAHDRFLVG